MEGLILTAIILCITYFTGSTIEKNHYKRIKQREIKQISYPAVSFEKKILPKSKKIINSQLVYGSVVICGDYFKDFVSVFRNFFGGTMVSYESLLDRARREAILRMKESAKGSDLILNIKIESVILNKGQKQPSKVSVLVYGTAITYGK